MGGRVTLTDILRNPGVQNKILRVAKYQRQRTAKSSNRESELEKQKLATKFFRQIESHFNPFAWLIIRNLARWAVRSSYEKVDVTASKKTLEEIAAGGVLMFSTHQSYMDIGILPALFNKYLPEMLRRMPGGMAHKSKMNVYIVAGANLPEVAVVENGHTVFVGDTPAARYTGWEPADRTVREAIAVKNYIAAKAVSLKNSVVDRIVDPCVNQPTRKGLRWLLKNSGAIYVKRRVDIKLNDTDSLILGEVFSAYIQELLRQGNSVTSFFGDGRQKLGEIMPLQFMVNEATLTTARYIIPITITHETLPKREENDFAKHIREKAEAASDATEKKRRGATFFYALTLPKWLRIVNPFSGTYGTVHVVFGEPISTADYFHSKVPSKAEFAGLKQSLLELAVSNVTLTPKNAVATAINVLGNGQLKVPDLEGKVCDLISVARSMNMHVSEKLTGPDSYWQIRSAIDYFVSRKALEMRSPTELGIRNPALLTYYAETAAKTFRRHIQ